VETGFSFELADTVAYDDFALTMRPRRWSGPQNAGHWTVRAPYLGGRNRTVSRLIVSFGWRCIALSRLVDDALDARVW
jgi:hypothetical protein